METPEPVSQVATLPVVPTPPPTSPQPKGKLPLLLLLLVMAILLVGGGYYLGTQKTATPVVPSPVPAVATPDPTANWETYSIKQVGMEFKLPPGLSTNGTLKEIEEAGESGMIFCYRYQKRSVSFIKSALAGGTECFPTRDDVFILGGTSVEYSAGRGGSFLDLQGFITQNEKLYARRVLNQLADLSSNQTQEITNQHGVKILKIKGETQTSEIYPDGIGLFGSLSNEYVGALVNTNNINYPGFSIQMFQDQNLNEQLFDQILSTFKFTDVEKNADRKTFSNADLYFQYSSSWKASGNQITSPDGLIVIRIADSDAPLMNECMQQFSVSRQNNVVVKRFERVTTGEMCAGGDDSPREIWVLPSDGVYAPGISYKYNVLDSIGESSFAQILSTFKFIN